MLFSRKVKISELIALLLYHNQNLTKSCCPFLFVYLKLFGFLIVEDVMVSYKSHKGSILIFVNKCLLVKKKEKEN